MVTLILGVITIVWVIVTRMPQAIPSLRDLPANIALPVGTRAAAFTQGSTWFAVVTTDDRILIFDRASGALRQTVVLLVGN